MRPFLFNVVVWNEDYVQRLLDFTIPCLLSPNNLPSLVRRRECEFVIVTTSRDSEQIKKSESYQRLASVIPVVFMFPDLGGDTKYRMMTVGHHHVAHYGKERKAYGVFLMPEMLIADGSLLYLDKIVLAGKRSAVMPVLRIVEERVNHLRTSGVINLSKRELAGLLLRHAHPEAHSFMVTNPERFCYEPGFVIWPYRSTWVVHGVHSQPVLVDLIDCVPGAFGLSIDSGDFVRASVPDLEQIDVVRDSDLAMMCSLTPEGTEPTAGLWIRPEAGLVGHFLHTTANITDTHRWYFRHPVLLHAEDVDPEVYEAEKDIAEFVRVALAYGRA